MRHVGCFKLYLQNNWGSCVVFHGGAGDLNSSLCIAFCCDVWFYLLEKTFLSEKYFVECKTLTVQSRIGGTHGMSGWASHQNSVVFFLLGFIWSTWNKGRDALNEANQREYSCGSYLWWSPHRGLGRALEVVYSQWDFSLNNWQCSINPRARVCSEQFVLLSHCFDSVLGCSAAWMGQRRALGSSGQHLLPSPVERRRKQEGSKAASSKIKVCDIPEYLTAWKALLCLVLPFIFLSEHLTVKALSCLKTLI